MQYGEYDSFEVFQDTIDSIVEDKVDELSVDEIVSIFKRHYSDPCRFEYGEKKEVLRL
ncbi:MAG TPA: hypothetical protein PLX08_00860 [Bacteroidales bacterium]|jgi:hypothetical protein|nr:hypothetical protein [Bacteroidales bacterium]